MYFSNLKSRIRKFLIKAAIILPLFFFPGLIFSEAAAGHLEDSKIAVLLYHHLEPQLSSDISDAIVSISEFEEQMKYLYEHGYYTASLSELEQYLYGKKNLPEKTVVITFDDGYESNYTYAYPILKRYNFKSAIFVIGSKIVRDDRSQEPGALSKLSAKQIKEMKKSGLVEFGCHTYDAHYYHPEKPGLLSLNMEEMLLDFEKLNREFEKMGLSRPTSIAYPYGKFDDSVIKAAKQKGYKIGFTVKSGFVSKTSNPMTLNRIIIPPYTGIDKFKALLKDDSLPLPEGFEDSIILAPGSHTVYIQGKPSLLKSQPVAINGVILAPLEFFTEILNGNLLFDPNLYQIAVPNAGNGGWNTVPAYRLNEEPMVPLNPVAKILNYDVLWHPEQNMIQLYKK